MSLLSARELRALRTVLLTTRDDWLINGMSVGEGGVDSVAGISNAVWREISIIGAKFGCKLPKYQGEVPLVGVDTASIDPMTVLLLIGIILLAVAGILRFMKSGQREQRRICRIPARLKINGKSYGTSIMNISRGGVMVEAPDTEAEITTVSLDLPEFGIASRVVWQNQNFLGLVFEKKISAQRMDEILRTGTVSAPVARPAAEAVPTSQMARKNLDATTG